MTRDEKAHFIRRVISDYFRHSTYAGAVANIILDEFERAETVETARLRWIEGKTTCPQCGAVKP